MNQTFCVNCGQGSKKVTEVQTVPYKEPYQGNQNVVLVRHSHPSHPRPYTDYTVWDGETYQRLRYGHFCKLECCRQFANLCAEAGYRRS